MRVAIAGATGEVGRTMRKVLESSETAVDDLHLFASGRSAGEILAFKGKSLTVEELTEENISEGFDYVLFSVGSDVSRKFAPLAARNGSVVIDNSSAFRMTSGIPLIVPEINGSLLGGYHGIVANPNCSTIQMVLSLYRVHERFGITFIVVSTYQAVSGAGKKGMDELKSQMDGDISPRIFPSQIHLNTIPMIGPLLENGFSEEEMKMVNETHKILGDENIQIWPTAVRVPVLYGHSESILVQTEREFDLDDIRQAVMDSKNVRLAETFKTPIDIAGTDITWISRIRTFDRRRFLMWNVADNIRVGAATNAVRILKKHIELNV